MSRSLMFGFPVRGQYPFTTVKDGSVHNGMEQYWEDIVAASRGITVVPEPTQEDLYGPVWSEEDTVGDAGREQLEQARQAYLEQVHAAIAEMGVELYAAGSQDFQPSYFVLALNPRNEHEQGIYCCEALPDLTVPEDVPARIKAFCELLGIPYEEPKWYLVDSYQLD